MSIPVSVRRSFLYPCIGVWVENLFWHILYKSSNNKLKHVLGHKQTFRSEESTNEDFNEKCFHVHPQPWWSAGKEWRKKYIYHINVAYYCDKGHYLLNRITIHFSAELNSLILKLDERYTANLEQCSHYHTKAKETRIAKPVEHGAPSGAPHWTVK